MNEGELSEAAVMATEYARRLRYDASSGKPLVIQEPFNSLSIELAFRDGAAYAFEMRDREALEIIHIKAQQELDRMRTVHE